MADEYAPDKIAREIEAAKALKAALGADADDAELLQDMIEGETSLLEMISAVLELIQQDQELIDGIKKRADDMSARKERIEWRQSGRRAKIEQALLIFGERKLELPECTLSLRKNASKLRIYSEDEVPSQFWKRKDPTIDRKSLTAALRGLSENDEPIPGAMLEPSPDSLAIRRK